MLPLNYIYWHYAIAPSAILGLLKNYLIGTWHRFLISTHFKMLFAPWHRTRPSEIGATINFGDKIADAIVDFYIRILAAVIRLFVILIGLTAEIFVIVVFLILFVVWLLWPLIFIFFLVKGLTFIFVGPYVPGYGILF